MFRLILTIASRTHWLLHKVAPSNILLNYIRTRHGLKWGVPAMLIGAGYFALAYWCTTLLDAGAPGWINLIVILGIYNGFRFTLIGPISLIRLLAARTREYRADLRAARADQAPHADTGAPTVRRHSAPALHEALPRDEYRASYLSRASSTARA